VRVVDELVTATAKDALVSELLEEIARQSELTLVSGSSGDERISIEFDQLPLQEALSRILRHRGFALEIARATGQAPGSDRSRTRRLWILSRVARGDQSPGVQSDVKYDPAFPSEILATITALRAELASKDADTREAAVDELGALGRIEAVSPLSLAFDDPDEHVRSAVVSALSEIGGEHAAAALSAAVGDENSEIRQEAVVALGEVGDEAGVRLLEQALDDEDRNVREAALAAVAQIGGHDAARVAAIALHDEEDSIRQAAVDALGDIGDETAIGFLQQFLNDHNRSIREAAADYLSELSDLDMSVR
jgi:hypothetical protein